MQSTAAHVMDPAPPLRKPDVHEYALHVPDRRAVVQSDETIASEGSYPSSYNDLLQEFVRLQDLSHAIVLHP